MEHEEIQYQVWKIVKKAFTDITSESESERLGRLYPVVLSEYNPNYMQSYVKEKLFLQQYFVDVILRISHIGSTAVPNLLSKPTIDILVEIKKDVNLTIITEKLTKKGYIVNRPPNDLIMYIKGYGEKGFEGQVFHIHVRELADHNELYFRDYLIAHPETAKEYGELKQAIYQKHKQDRDGYTYAKSEFISQITKLARREFKDKYNPCSCALCENAV